MTFKNQRGSETQCEGVGNEWKALVRPLLEHLRRSVGNVEWRTPPLPAGYLCYVSGDGIRLVVFKDQGRPHATEDRHGWVKPAYRPFTKIRADVLVQ